MLRIHHFCLWLLLQVAKVPEPTSAPTKFGRLRILLQASTGTNTGSLLKFSELNLS